MIVAVALLLGACAQTKSFLTSESLAQKPANPRVLIMPTDVELSELTAAGLLEPNAAWTAAGRSNVDAALDSLLAGRNATIVRYDESDTANSDAESQLIKLHSVVGGTILWHKYFPALALPTKKDKFDWGLGEGATALREPYGADYALFIYLRDSFASDGRKAAIVMAALFGVGVQGGTQVGFASLVDLRNGEIIWFNRLVSQAGDLREPELARGATENLLDDLPL
ncbi:MAG: hypothetical protein ACTSW2_02085 [Alphaproteobacteria bacterium]